MPNQSFTPLAPLFRDPIYDGAADPTIIWNRQEKTWWLVYTNRRANVACQGVAWVHGTDLGIASSNDGGASWLYRGTLQDLHYQPGRNTYWAPEILWHADRYHMYVSYVPGIPLDWSGPREMLHYTSLNMWDWQFESKLSLSSNKVIDACVFRMPSGRWRMWYKDEVNHGHTYAAESDDLYSWQVVGPVITEMAHEGPNVFVWHGAYWMIVDYWHGQAVYRSSDALSWTRQADILGSPGMRADDGAIGRHADVLVQGDEAYIFYFTHPGEKLGKHYARAEVWPFEEKRTSLQVARLVYVDGVLICNRDEPFELKLEAPTDSLAC